VANTGSRGALRGGALAPSASTPLLQRGAAERPLCCRLHQCKRHWSIESLAPWQCQVREERHAPVQCPLRVDAAQSLPSPLLLLLPLPSPCGPGAAGRRLTQVSLHETDRTGEPPAPCGQPPGARTHSVVRSVQHTEHTHIRAQHEAGHLSPSALSWAGPLRLCPSRAFAAAMAAARR
jgi:hypothetical protein